MKHDRPTRGTGMLEPLLAGLRARQANALIPAPLRAGSILDIGCGTTPYFLSHTSFKERVGVDRQCGNTLEQGIRLHQLDLHEVTTLPFESSKFSVVAMLAVVEHFDADTVRVLFREAFRITKPGGMVIITTPAPWAHGLLKAMSRINLVSRQEIEEHCHLCSASRLRQDLCASGFSNHQIRTGMFELGVNLWATAVR